MAKIYTQPKDKLKNRKFGAACSKCGGWTKYGGMSQYSYGPMGCDCGTNKFHKLTKQQRAEIKEVKKWNKSM